MIKSYCLLCQKEVEVNVLYQKIKYDDEVMNVVFDGQIANCPYCHEEIYVDEIEEYNQSQINKMYIKKYDIISKNDILMILSKYDIEPKSLSTLLNFKEDLIEKYLEDYLPTIVNSKILFEVLNCPKKFLQILLNNKSLISNDAYLKSIVAVNKLLN